LLSLASLCIEGPDEALMGALQMRSFGDYELLEEIARGGMGVVYRAKQLSLGREVAVKMILAGELATTESVQRFRNEAATAARLDHPNIVSVYEIGEHDMQHYFSMRLVLGRRNIAMWARALASAGRAKSIATMMAKVAHAVAFAHERGVLHRDLKPSNILVDDQGEPQVTDFGLAKLLNEQDSGLTLSAVMMGSPSYMAPEQADGRHGDVTTLTDVYGLGAVLYELLAGRPPFAGASPLATAKLVVEQMPAPLTETARDLATICLKCLAKEPAQRYASAHELAEDLERFSSGEAIRARPVTVPEAVWRWARRSPKVAALVGVALLASVLGVVGITWQWRQAEHARHEQQRALDHLAWNEIARQSDTDEMPIALAKLAGRLRENPSHWQAAMLAMSMIDQHSFPVLAGPPVRPAVKLVTAPRLAPDGSWFAAAGEDHVVRAWDAATGEERVRIMLAAPVTALAVADGPLAIATGDGCITLRANVDAEPVSLRRSSPQPVQTLRFSADGAWLVAQTKVRVEIWKCAEPKLPPGEFALEGGVVGSQLSAEGARLLIWNPKKATVMDTVSGRPLFQAEAGERFGRGALAGNGERISMIDGRFTVRAWQVDSGVLLSSVESQPAPASFLVLNGDGTRVTLATTANDLAVFDTASGLKVSPPMNHLYNPLALIASVDGTTTASYGKDGRIRVWDAESGRSICSPVWINTETTGELDASRDGRTVLVAPQSVRDGSAAISIWHGSALRPVHRQRPPDLFAEMAGNRLSPDGRLGCLSLSPVYRAYVYELASGREVFKAPTHGDVYLHMFSPDMHRYYAYTGNGWLHGWSLETCAELWPPIRQTGGNRGGDISPDGRYLVAGQSDGHISIHDSAKGTLVGTLDHPGEIKVLRFAPDGSGRFFTGSTDRVAHVWDVKTGAQLSTLAGHTNSILAGAWSPDSRFVATASYDQTVRVWDAATGASVGQVMQHLSWLAHLEFSPDGRLLATACRDGTVRFWHSLTGLPASAPLPLASTPVTVRFTADGRCLLVRDHLGFSFWDTARAEQVTVHYSAPVASGYGFDAAPIRAIVSPDGTLVHLGVSMMEGLHWVIPQPREAVPPWFPELLESLAQVHLEGGVVRLFPGDGILRLKKDLLERRLNGYYADWARWVLGLEVGE
jgi:WD40 repeat protein